MANLAYKTINAQDDYKDIEDELDITLESGKSYQIQSFDTAIFCESSSKPTAGGFLVKSGEKFTFKKSSDKLYVKSIMNTVTINIGE